MLHYTAFQNTHILFLNWQCSYYIYMCTIYHVKVFLLCNVCVTIVDNMRRDNDSVQ